MILSDGVDDGLAAVSTAATEHAEAVDRDSRMPEEAVAAMRRARLLSWLIPSSLGGQQRSFAHVAAACHATARSCGSAGMILAMHHIQVACIVAHGQDSPWHQSMLRRIAEEQLLLGSVTSEAGNGGNIHASICSVEADEESFSLQKDATTISYGAQSDVLLITARRAPDAAPSDQVMVVALREDYTLQRTSLWNALGMRGTCSDGFLLRMSGHPRQILPVPFADIASQTMLPASHLLWSSVWLGIAADAVARARRFLRQQVRTGRGSLPPSSRRLATAVGLMQLMQSRLSTALKDYDANCAAALRPLPLGFTAEMNSLKTSVSELCQDVVRHAFMVCGIAAYRNHSEFSLGRHIRDLLSAPVMINNDRILESTGNLLLMQKPDLGVL